MRILFAVALLITSLAITTSTAAHPMQDPTPTPTPESEEIKRLREEKTRAELEKDIAVAEKAKFDAEFPKPSTSPLSGETKINEAAVIESEMVSYLSMAYAANRIVERLRDTNLASGKKLVINNLAVYNRNDIDLLLNYKATTAQLEILTKEFCKYVPDAAECPGGTKGTRRALGTGLGIVSSFLGAFVDLTALMRTNVTIQGHTFSVDEAALVSEVFRALRAQDALPTKPNLYYPAAFPPTDLSSESKLLLALEELNDLKAKSLVKIKELEKQLEEIGELKDQIAKLEAFINAAPQKITDAETELHRLEELQKQFNKQRRRMPFEALERMARLRETIKKLREDLNAAPGKLEKANAELETKNDEDVIKEDLSKLRLLNERFDKLIDTLIKTDNATGINSLTAYLRAENLMAVMNGENDYWLQLAVVKAGGNNRIKSNLLIDVFTGGSRLSHSGGSIVQYNLYDLKGKSVVSDTLTEYTGYIKAGKIKRLLNPVNVADVPNRKARNP